MEDGKIVFIDEDGEEVTFYIVEETRVNDISYILVTETEDEDDGDKEADAYIMKDVSDPEDEQARYEFVEDDTELDAVAGIFSELLEDEAELI